MNEQNLASWTPRRLLAALTELANASTEGNAEQFLARWPEFFPLDIEERNVRIFMTPDHVKAMREAAENPPPEELREPPPEAKLGEMPSLGQASRTLVVMLADDLQRIWRGSPEGQRLLTMFLLYPNPYDAHLAFIGFSSSRAEPEMVLDSIQADWRRGGFAYTPRTHLQAALHLLLKRSSLAKICGNPDCPAPYFVAGRSIQRYCSEKCAKPFRLQSQKKWWDRVGKVERQKRAKKARRKSSPKTEGER
jgi:hypothetical protein